MEEQLRRVIAFNALIRRKATGSPEEMAQRFDISVSLVKKIIRCMREILDAPIEYNRVRKSYVYTKEGTVKLGFEDNRKAEIIAIIKNVLEEEEKA
jgi:transcription initiation factor IIE alpha subunit